ncbi:hypothetical protein Patl1_12060 [Pistacia atlantica]|uniref:Uncharacterized protein n=1 Tax=Pistacia atlantica TaxID=434234 RepID=A0ACC1A5J2_9ROSI|nr:hypothetical protein Patl1_12060 [Pistacia atlantica]
MTDKYIHTMILVVVLYLSSFLLITFTNAFITPTFLAYSCPPTKNFTINSTYHSNLNILLSSLPSYNNLVSHATTTGQVPNKVYGLFLCRGDLNSTACQDCVVSATRDVTRYCPIKKEAVIWYDECHLRYSNIEPFFSSWNRGPSIWKPDAGNVTEPGNFDDLVSSLISEAANKAAYSPNKFAAVKKKSSSVNQTLYGLVQCTQDLSISDCFICLQEANSQLPSCCGGKKGGRVLTSSCNVRFELYPFVNETFISTLAPLPASKPPHLPLVPPAPGSVTTSHAPLSASKPPHLPLVPPAPGSVTTSNAPLPASKPPYLPLVPPAPGSVTTSHDGELLKDELDDEGFATKALQHLLLYLSLLPIQWFGLV